MTSAPATAPTSTPTTPDLGGDPGVDPGGDPGVVVAGSTLPLPSRVGAPWAPDRLRSDLRALAGYGFRHVDLVDTWVAPADLTDPERRDLTTALSESGLVPVGISVIRRSIIDPHSGDENYEYTKRSIIAAAQLEAPVLSIGFHRPLTPAQRAWGAFWEVPGPEDHPDAFASAVKQLRQLAVMAADEGVALSLELYEDTLIGSGSGAARLVETVGHPALGINADLANLYRVPRRLPETWQDALKAVLPHMNYWHVKNYRRISSHPDGPFYAWPTELADGDIDYRYAITTALEHGYQGPINIEHYGGDGLSSQGAGLQYLQRLLASMNRSVD